VEVVSTSNKPKNRAVLQASKSGSQPIVERQRSLAEYMSLPASQYSVLDARKIERVNDDTFKCYVGQLRMFSWSVEPVLTVSVTVEPEAQGCTIRLLSCELKGSKSVEEINNKFTASMTNVVRWREVERMSAPPDAVRDHATASAREIVSTTELKVELEVPSWCSFIPVSSIENVGTNVMQGVLNAMVPRFLVQLQKDYELWASGDTSRQPVGEL